ncbi:MAG: hypothetical protein UU47_C0016G0008 [candidate division TM6 bacterium GW2011_GWE2_41_16]|nr:MAG: hypothetical protein UU47_C0016G0008 [candidate division TM6 bacterium GW2011_GWE2_41_16]
MKYLSCVTITIFLFCNLGAMEQLSEQKLSTPLSQQIIKQQKIVQWQIYEWYQSKLFEPYLNLLEQYLTKKFDAYETWFKWNYFKQKAQYQPAYAAARDGAWEEYLELSGGKETQLNKKFLGYYARCIDHTLLRAYAEQPNVQMVMSVREDSISKKNVESEEEVVIFKSGALAEYIVGLEKIAGLGSCAIENGKIEDYTAYQGAVSSVIHDLELYQCAQRIGRKCPMLPSMEELRVEEPWWEAGVI